MSKELKQKAREMFDEKFKCIQGDCDGTGCIPVARTVGRQISETEFVEDVEWEAEQCQFHTEYILPIKSFIDSIIDLTIKERDEILLKDIELWLLRLHNEPEKWTVDQAINSIKTLTK